MAEYCLECWNKINKTNDPPEKYRISHDLDLCEGCGELKPVIIKPRKYASFFEDISDLIWDLFHKDI